MKSPFLFFLTPFLILISCSGQEAVQARSLPPDRPPARRALLIGINDYKALRPLSGSLNDVAAVEQVLSSKFGFDDITVLTDEAATREAILASLKTLVNKAGPEDRIYVHFSGHGSQVEDLNGDEVLQDDDGADETILSWDGRADGVPDITDDEIGEILSGLKTEKVILCFDACHSGTATRSIDMTVQTRSVPRDTRIELYKKSMIGTRDIVSMEDRYMLLTGAGSHQEALDGPISNGRCYGVFTYALTSVLDRARPDATPREIERAIDGEYRRIQEEFGRESMPEPQFEMPETWFDRPLLPPVDDGRGASGGIRRAWVSVVNRKSAEVLLSRGPSLGGLPGALFAVYPPGEQEFAPGKALAVIKVEALEGRDSRGRMLNGGCSLPSDCRAVMIAPPFVGGRIPVHLRDVPSQRVDGLVSTLEKQFEDVLLVGPEEFARFIVDVKDDQCAVFGADGLQEVCSFLLQGERTLGERMGTFLTRSQNAAALLSLDNPNSNMELSVRVAISGDPTLSRTGTRGIRVTSNLEAPQYRIKRDGDPRTKQNSLLLEIEVSEEAYVTIVDVDSEGGVNLLFPNERQSGSFFPDGRIPGGRKILIPDSLEQGNQAKFNWDYWYPIGLDTVRVFATPDVEKAEEIRKSIREIAGAAGSPGTGTRAVESLARLREALAGRGIIVVSNTPEDEIPEEAAEPEKAESDWTASSITLRISE